MNIKRAFLAAAAVLMVPGYAMAQTVNFDTQVMTTNGTDVTIHAYLLCNTGNPLEQEADISPGAGNGNDFIVQNIVVDGDTSCGITFSDLPAGYTVYDISTNGTDYPADEPPHCRWNTAEDDSPVEPSNYCYITLAPAPFEYTMKKVWEIDSDVDVSESFSMSYTCYNVYTSTSDTTLGTYGSSWGGSGDDSYTRSNWYPDPEGTTYCTASENVYDSAVESDQGCQNPVNFSPENITGECTVTNTVFFEGIPTLSQYGLAILAVLMLGVGFIGFRRFV